MSQHNPGLFLAQARNEFFQTGTTRDILASIPVRPPKPNPPRPNPQTTLTVVPMPQSINDLDMIVADAEPASTPSPLDIKHWGCDRDIEFMYMHQVQSSNIAPGTDINTLETSGVLDVLDFVNGELKKLAAAYGVHPSFFQSNIVDSNFKRCTK